MNLGPTVPYLIRNANSLLRRRFRRRCPVEIAELLPRQQFAQHPFLLPIHRYLVAVERPAPNDQRRDVRRLAHHSGGHGRGQWLDPPRRRQILLRTRNRCASPARYLQPLHSEPRFGSVPWFCDAANLVFGWGSRLRIAALTSADNFYVADASMGTAEDELVQYSPNDQYLFVLKFDGQSFTYISSPHADCGTLGRCRAMTGTSRLTWSRAPPINWSSSPIKAPPLAY